MQRSDTAGSTPNRCRVGRTSGRRLVHQRPGLATGSHTEAGRSSRRPLSSSKQVGTILAACRAGRAACQRHPVRAPFFAVPHRAQERRNGLPGIAQKRRGESRSKNATPWYPWQRNMPAKRAADKAGLGETKTSQSTCAPRKESSTP